MCQETTFLKNEDRFLSLRRRVGPETICNGHFSCTLKWQITQFTGCRFCNLLFAKYQIRFNNKSKSLQPKGIYFVRPAMNQYFTNSEEINEAANMLFKQISSGNVKIEIYKKYKLEDAVQAHKDLEGRKITGPAVIIP